MATTVRYVKQRDFYSCGPVAILNVLKWLGVKVTYKDLPSLQIMCNCDIDVGTDKADMERAMRKLEIKNKRKMFPTLKEMDAHLDSGGIIIVNYFMTQFDGHYALCIDKTEKHYTLVNDSPTETITSIERRVFKKMLYKCRLDEEPWVWFIFKQEKNEKQTRFSRKSGTWRKKVYAKRVASQKRIRFR